MSIWIQILVCHMIKYHKARTNQESRTNPYYIPISAKKDTLFLIYTFIANFDNYNAPHFLFCDDPQIDLNFKQTNVYCSTLV